MNYLIDRHIQVGFMIVDDMFTTHTPELAKDIHWADTVPTILPYTEETVHYRKEEPKCGAEKNVRNTCLALSCSGCSKHSKAYFIKSNRLQLAIFLIPILTQFWFSC